VSRKTFCILMVAIMVLFAYVVWMAMWLAMWPVKPQLPDWLCPWRSRPNEVGHQSLSQAVWSPNQAVHR